MAPSSVLLLLAANIITASASPVRGKKAREVGYVGVETKHTPVLASITQGYVGKATVSYMADEQPISDDEHPNIVETMKHSSNVQAQLNNTENQSSLPSLSTLVFIFCVAGFVAMLYRSAKTQQLKGGGVKQGAWQDFPYVQEALAVFGNVGQKAVVTTDEKCEFGLPDDAQCEDSGLLDDAECEAESSQFVKDASVGFFAEDEAEPETPLVNEAHV